MSRANDDNLMNMFDALLVVKLDVNIMLRADPVMVSQQVPMMWE